MSREAFSVACYPTDPEEWEQDGHNPYSWVEPRLRWCLDNDINLAGLDQQSYVFCEGEEYIPVGKTIVVLEFRFRSADDATLFKLVWG